MNITSDNTRETRRYDRVIRLQGAEPLTTGEGWHAHAGKEYLPDTVVINWNYGTEPYSAKVSGNVLKKDGEPSANRTSRTYYLDSPAGITKVAPEWLAEIINSCKPEGN